MNISEFVKHAHDNAVNKGFYDCPECGKLGYTPDPHGHICFYCNGAGKDVEKNVGELLMLVVSELGEALEAHRKHGIARPNLDNIESLYITYDRFSKPEYLEEFQIHFERHVKDTFSDELADACIRLFDMCGYLNITPVDFPHGVTISENVGEFLLNITRMVCDIQIHIEDGKYVNELIYEIIHYIKVFCDCNNIDLLKHIELKMKYNETREYKHGKNY